MGEMDNLVNALTHLVQSQQQLTQALGQQSQSTGSNPKISVKIPSYKGESKATIQS